MVSAQRALAAEFQRDAHARAVLGAIKWRERAPFTAADTATLAAQRDTIPGADHRTPLIGISRNGFDTDAGLDLQLGPEDLL